LARIFLEFITTYALAGPKFFYTLLSPTYVCAVSEFVDRPFATHPGNGHGLPHANGTGRENIRKGLSANWM
jgi:hypothetical protein